ncbi:MAG TPA: PucC family protein [Candidatus Eisenbergiella pullistercoris]|uniref:PucC family protein n=1 Tax=Candidatus Eisenbergiella pullistercoris TaxID=2838555 RepID=A0A9D1YND3_9FIRM|nr:PucC family protein [Candidatus Eisenbergiella pullistercoris]
MNQKNEKKITPKQIAAIVCIVLLVGMYVATLIVALLDFSGADRLFQACLVATIGLPILLWIYIWLYQQVKKRKEEQEGS